ncbi:MAG: FHA domain-containing protein [Planctomycetes bacterium]|nr:FHA domain-containing protein [Planctomycetota bacterium]
MINVSTPIESRSKDESTDRSRLMLWIDGVGAYLLCLGQRVSIGGPAVDSNPAEIPLLANLSRRHATFVRNGEGYLLEAHSLTRVAGRPIADRTYLNDGYELEFGDSVRLRFRLPSVLSTSARLEFLSNHRPAYNVDGVILMDESCLIGPGAENHVQCSDWPESVVLFLRNSELYCKARSSLFIDGVPAGDDSAISPGNVVTGTDFCFRIETIE